MTRKDYEMIADELNKRLQAEIEYGRPQGSRAVQEVMWSLVGVFASDNPRFNPDKFIARVRGIN